MKITVTPLTGIEVARRACELTMHGQTSRISVANLARCEHSPLRALTYWVEMQGIPTFVSVHLVRHKHGVEHFVKSMRDDLYVDPETIADRNTPVNHGMLINAQALIQMARKRLCYKSHRRTIAVMRKIKAALAQVEPELAPYLVPECVYRNGYCPEIKECRPGLKKVCAAYGLEVTDMREPSFKAAIAPQEVKEGDIVFTMECRALYEPGGCGEAVTQKTRYRVIRHPKYTELMAECLDYPALKELKELKSFGLAWEQKGYALDV